MKCGNYRFFNVDIVRFLMWDCINCTCKDHHCCTCKKHIQTRNKFSEGGKLYRIAELTMQIPKSTTHRWEFRLSCVCAQV